MKNKIIKIVAAGILLTLFMACAESKPKPEAPAWTNQPTRQVDNGYIIYRGFSEDFNGERANFKAEFMAVQDLANECSFPPKGTRTEDRYEETDSKGHVKAYAKVAVEFSECDDAKKAVTPDDIRALANVPLTEELKKYQDMVDNDEEPTQVASGDSQPLSLPPSPPPSTGGVMIIQSEPAFFAMRQDYLYQKQVVILSPPTAYATASPESASFTKAMQGQSTQLHEYEVAHPEIQKSHQGWSNVPNRPQVRRPENLRSMRMPERSMSKPLRLPQNPHGSSPQRSRGHEERGRRRRHRE